SPGEASQRREDWRCLHFCKEWVRRTQKTPVADCRDRGFPAVTAEIIRGALRGLAAQHCVLEGLGCAESHNGLGLDLDRLSGLRIATHACFAVGLNGASQIG